jgi:hypothetical protein
MGCNVLPLNDYIVLFIPRCDFPLEFYLGFISPDCTGNYYFCTLFTVCPKRIARAVIQQDVLHPAQIYFYVI